MVSVDQLRFGKFQSHATEINLVQATAVGINFIIDLANIETGQPYFLEQGLATGSEYHCMGD